MINNVTQCIYAFFNCVMNFVVDGTEIICNNAGFFKIRGTFQTDGKRMESREPCLGLAVVFNTSFCKMFGNCRMTDESRLRTKAHRTERHTSTGA